MIVDMENTTAASIEKKLNELRDENGVVTLGRVLTLVILAQAGHSEMAIEAANYASHEHPCRIIVHVAHSSSDETRLDAQLRMGCLLYTSPSPRDATLSRMPSSA